MSIQDRTSRVARDASRAPFYGGLLAVIVLTLLALALVRVQADARREVERRFEERTRVTAAVTESLFASSVGSSQELNARRYGGPTVPSSTLERAAAQNRSPYLVLLDSRGRVLAATKRATPQLLARLQERPAHFRAALTKAGFGVSDVLTETRSAASEFATAFKAADGEPRVLVSGISTEVLAGFIGGYLARIPNFENSSAYLVDSRDHIVATTRRAVEPGEQLGEAGLADALRRGRHGKFDGDRYYSSDAVAGTPWRTVLTADQQDLYASVSGTRQLVPWLVFLLLACVAAASLWLFVRVVRSAAALGSVNRQLEESHRRLETRAGELARSNAELEQFASVASHDLQEPLRKVQAFGEQLETKYASILPEDGVDYLRRMRSASARMQNLIDDLLRFARVTTRAQPFELVDLRAIAGEAAADLEVQARGASIEIGTLPRLEADPLQMRQLLQNLLSNALKFHRPGVPPKVAVHGDSRAGVAVIIVRDNGIGFEDRHRERIFRVFERLHGRTVYDGTGIGLALCRRIVERHGGTISANGVAGEGATFTVVLPLEQAEIALAEPTATPPATVEEIREPAHVG